MQSHLQAALLGQGCNGNAHASLATQEQHSATELDEDGDDEVYPDEVTL